LHEGGHGRKEVPCSEKTPGYLGQAGDLSLLGVSGDYAASLAAGTFAYDSATYTARFPPGCDSVSWTSRS